MLPAAAGSRLLPAAPACSWLLPAASACPRLLPAGPGFPACCALCERLEQTFSAELRKARVPFFSLSQVQARYDWQQEA